MAAGDSIFPQMSNRANNRICLTHFVSCILLYSVFFITNRVFPSLNGSGAASAQLEFGSQVSKKSLKQMSGFLVDLERLPVESH